MTRQFHWYDKAKWPFSRTQKSPFTYNTLQINRLRKYAEIRWFQRKEDSGSKKRRHKAGKMSVFLTKGHSSYKVRTVRHTQIHQTANPCQPSNKHSESRQLYPYPTFIWHRDDGRGAVPPCRKRTDYGRGQCQKVPTLSHADRKNQKKAVHNDKDDASVRVRRFTGHHRYLHHIIYIGRNRLLIMVLSKPHCKVTLILFRWHVDKKSIEWKSTANNSNAYSMVIQIYKYTLVYILIFYKHFLLFCLHLK